MNKKTVVLRLYRLSIVNKIALGRFVVTSMTNNPHFPMPNPALSIITTNTNNLESAHTAAQGGGVDDTANMHAKEVIFDLSMSLLAAYVEGIANADPINAEAIILSSGMSIKTHTTRASHDFNVQTTGNVGELKVATKAAKNATYIFQMSTDTTVDSNWQTIQMSTRSRFVKTGLNSGTRYYFRSCIVDMHGQGPWSTVLNAIAL